MIELIESPGWSIAIVFLISALIGLTVVKVVEARMSDISINMPTIKLPKQNITVRVTDEDLGTGIGTSVRDKQGTVIYNSLDSLDYRPSASAPAPAPPTMPVPTTDQEGGSGNTICKQSLPPARTVYNNNKYRSESKEMPKSTVKVPPPSSRSAQQSYPATYPRVKPVLTDPKPDATQTQTYYQDPKTMTPVQLIKFQQRAKFENMTVLDYQNWLLTFVDNPERLVGFHRANLKVLVRGGQLYPTDMPSRTRLPDNGRDQYNQIIAGTGPDQIQIQDNIPQPEYLGFHPSNYEDQVGHPSKVRNLRHLDYVNPDEPLKTWILTRTPSTEK